MGSFRFISRVILGALVAAGCASKAANAQAVNGNGTGNNNGYFYSLYSSGWSVNATVWSFVES